MNEKSAAGRRVRRRELLAGTAAFFLSVGQSRASLISGALPWTPNAGNPPTRVKPGPWLFFTGAEGRAMEAIAVAYSAGSETPGGRDAGCAVFIDRQLAGPYGQQDGLYLRPPFQVGMKKRASIRSGANAEIPRGARGPQKACKAKYADKEFAELSDSDNPAGYLPGGGGFETLLGKAQDGRLQEQAAGFTGWAVMDRALMGSPNRSADQTQAPSIGPGGLRPIAVKDAGRPPPRPLGRRRGPWCLGGQRFPDPDHGWRPAARSEVGQADLPKSLQKDYLQSANHPHDGSEVENIVMGYVI